MTPKAYMAEALVQARLAFELGEVPVGAVLVQNNQIIARAHNTKEQKRDAFAHAEMLVLTQMQALIGDWRLTDCDLYVTLEPCPMCLGAMFHTRLRTVYYGAKESCWGAITSRVSLAEPGLFNHNLNCEYLEMPECGQILSDFFKKIRQK